MIHKRKAFIFAIAVCVLSLAAAAPRARAQQGAPTAAQMHALMAEISDAFESAADKVSDFVVPIFAEQVVRTPAQGFPEDPFREFFGNDFFKRFFGTTPQPQTRTVRSLGSGVVVSPEGHILTNNHVVEGADKLTVILKDKRRLQARVIGTDPLTDVAVIKIEAAGLPAAVLGDSDAVKVGQWVIAVGNPFALLRTVTHGIISATGRSAVGLATYEDFIQTDAPINPGNSGGALADLDGNVIGINSAISSPTGGNVGLGFAIPINMAKSIMSQLLAKGKVVRGYLGVTAQDIDESLVGPLKLKDTSGALVSEVNPDTPAARATLKPGDVIVEFDGKKVAASRDLSNMAAETPPGKAVKIVVLRGSERLELTATLGERPQEKGSAKAGQPGGSRGPTAEKLGLTVQTLTSDIARQLGYGDDKGVLITDVTPGGAGDDAELKPGDLIKEVNRVQVTTAQDFERIVRDAKKGDTLALLVRRGQGSFFVGVKIP
ncbi:MAG TPA: DegQ family serine endoprotease [Candidatus Bathyarchaeia archaeon]|nr:DegQ family serine endoprotease [Candidatus Bathyarchaeia archaeon]